MITHQKIFKVKANEFQFTISQSDLDAIDIISNHAGEYNLIKDHSSLNAKIVASDITGKKATIEVNGETFDVEIKDELDQMLESMGFGKAATRQIKEIKAPMPGLVLDISVAVGQEVKEGERILILEAMKMENSIMIHTDATIKAIRVKPGQAVEKGQVLVDLD